VDEFTGKHFILPEALRSKLAKPMGELIEGSIEETVPILRTKLVPHDFILVAVGDVTAEIFVDKGFSPDIIVTDGQREELNEWKTWDGYEILEATCPAAEITAEAWTTLKLAVKKSSVSQVHVKIHGEEDLLVLPLLIELPDGSKIVYGQPNRGAVIRTVTDESRQDAKDIINQMEIKE